MLEYWNSGNHKTLCRKCPKHLAFDRLDKVSPSRNIIPIFPYSRIPVWSYRNAPSDDETDTKSKTENAPTSLLFLQASTDSRCAYNLGLKVT